MAFKMKGFPLRSGFTHAVNIDKHEHVDAAEGSGGNGAGGGDTEVNVNNDVNMKKDPFTPVVEDDAYKNAKLKKALARYNYFKDQKERGVYKGDLGPIPTMNNLDDFDMNDGSYKY